MKMIKEFFIADDFKFSPYGYITNQISHVALGCFSSFMLSILFFMLHDEYPIKEKIIIFIFISYILKEIFLDKWVGFDTIEDILFVCFYGAGGSILSFSEVSPRNFSLIFDPYWCAIVLPAVALHLCVGYFLRCKNAKSC